MQTPGDNDTGGEQQQQQQQQPQQPTVIPNQDSLIPDLLNMDISAPPVVPAAQPGTDASGGEPVYDFMLFILVHSNHERITVLFLDNSLSTSMHTLLLNIAMYMLLLGNS